MLRYSFAALKRTPVKAVLFFVLLAAVTAFLCLGLTIQDNSRKLQKQADESFVTKALFEYVGGSYPDETLFSSDTVLELEELDLSVITDSPLTKDFSKENHAQGYLEDITLNENFNIPFTDRDILQAVVLYINEDNISLVLQKSYISGLMDGYIVRIKTGELTKDGAVSEDGFLYQIGHTYFMHGEFSKSNGLMFFDTTHFDYSEDDMTAEAAVAAEKAGIFPVADITDAVSQAVDYIDTEQGEYWRNLIDFYSIQNQSLPVTITEDITMLREFYMNEISMKEGSLFTADDLQENKKVCIISNSLAYLGGYSVGDTISIALHASKNPVNYYSSYWEEEGLGETVDYEIRGIYTSMANGILSTIYVNSQKPETLPSVPVSYTLGTAVIENGKASEFIEEMQDKLPQAVRITIFDQGYEQTTTPLKDLQQTAWYLVAICCICGVPILVLFAFLNITKQRETVAVMQNLGTGKHLIKRYLMGGAFMISIPAVVFGSLTGYLFSFRIFVSVYEKAVSDYSDDLRFSISAKGPALELNETITNSILIPCCIGVAVLVLTSLFCFVLSGRLLREVSDFSGNGGRKRRIDKNKTVNKVVERDDTKTIEKDDIKVIRKDDPKTIEQDNSFIDTESETASMKESKLHQKTFILKHALRSISRNKRMSILVPLISIVFTTLILIFSSIINAYYKELKQIYNSTPVLGYFASNSGRAMSMSQIPYHLFSMFIESPFLKAIHSSSTEYYEYVGEYSTETMSLIGEPKVSLDYPGSSFAMETRIRQIFFEDAQLVFTDQINYSPEFYQNTAPTINWLSGYEEEFYSASEYNCLVTNRFLENNKLELGDVIQIAVIFLNESGYDHVIKNMRIVGSYQGIDEKDLIYCSDLIRSDVSMDGQSDFICYELKNTAFLSVLRDQLEKNGVTTVGTLGSARTSFVIDDKNLNQSAGNLKKTIGFMVTIYVAVLFLVLGIGFVVSYLFIRTRKQEIAIMRSMGTGDKTVFRMFFFEQMLLCLLGGAIGVGISGLFFLTTPNYLGLVIYLMFYLIGSVIAIVTVNRKNVLAILSAAE